MSLNKLVGTPLSNGKFAQDGKSRPNTVQLGRGHAKGGCWPKSDRYAVEGVNKSGTPRYGSLLD